MSPTEASRWSGDRLGISVPPPPCHGSPIATVRLATSASANRSSRTACPSRLSTSTPRRTLLDTRAQGKPTGQPHGSEVEEGRLWIYQSSRSRPKRGQMWICLEPRSKSSGRPLVVQLDCPRSHSRHGTSGFGNC
ncbi:unnamed protein product [Protopolystoma xenopodis]|uniref:Uncharacterized protein n=1 Tax=Protopolystoma xenopodis TaxID=117903 RepID=A0A3S5AFY7_9PLAT|nr:unnamed protein product [Protopolystoma xenopodis]